MGVSPCGQKRTLELHLPDFAAYGYVSLIETREMDDQFVAVRSKMVETKLRFCLQSRAVRTLDDDGKTRVALTIRERQIGRQNQPSTGEQEAVLDT